MCTELIRAKHNYKFPLIEATYRDVDGKKVTVYEEVEKEIKKNDCFSPTVYGSDIFIYYFILII